jgi:hypothetical protein
MSKFFEYRTHMQFAKDIYQWVAKQFPYVYAECRSDPTNFGERFRAEYGDSPLGEMFEQALLQPTLSEAKKYIRHFNEVANANLLNPAFYGELFQYGLDQRRSEIAAAKTSMHENGKDDLFQEPFTAQLVATDIEWTKAEKPYYNIWTQVIDGLLSVDLKADSSYFRLPLDTLLLRFAEDNPLRFHYKGDWQVQTVLAYNTILPVTGSPGKTVRGVGFWVDINESCLEKRLQGEGGDLQLAKCSRKNGDIPTYLYKHFICEEGKSIDWSFDNIPAHGSAWRGVRYPDDIVRKIAKIVATICLLNNDSELVEPVILSKDRPKLTEANRPLLVAKARRKGHNGWDVGRKVEVAPHVRRAHFALYHTGKGRKIPVIRLRRSTVVQRQRIAEVPTGYLAREEGSNGN